MALDFGIVFFTIVTGLLVAVLVWSLTRKSAQQPNKKVKNEKSSGNKKDAKKSHGTQSKPKKKTAVVGANKDSKSTFTHSWLLTSLKGHTGAITDMDYSPNGKHLATCAEDRTLMLWEVNLSSLGSSVLELNMKDIKTLRSHVQYDHASFIRWSPDSKALLTVRALGNNIEIYKVSKKADKSSLSIQSSHTFEKTREDDILAVDLASTGRFIMTCTSKNELDILDLKGNIISSIVTNQMETYFAKVSPDGRYVATSGFTPEVRVWEVVFSKSGEFEKVNRAFELVGHTSGIYSFDFSPDSGKMVTLSKDGTWRLYNTNIDYRQGQLATLLTSGKWKLAGSQSGCIALAPDGRVLAVGIGTSLYVYSTLNGEQLAHIPDVHSAPIVRVRFDSASRFILTTGDKYVRVFHNVPGYKIAVVDLETKLKKATGQAMRERCQIQLKEAQAFVDLFNARD